MRIYVEEIKRGGKFRARLDGMIIVEGSRQPLLDAARVLHARGVTGMLEMWGGAPPGLRMSGDIEWMAGKTIREENKSGLRLRDWEPDRRWRDGSPAAEKQLEDE